MSNVIVNLGLGVIDAKFRYSCVEVFKLNVCWEAQLISFNYLLECIFMLFQKVLLYF